MNDEFNYISLFAGGGGMHIGLEQAGFKPLFATDIEKSSEMTFKENYPDLPYILGDIRRLTKSLIDSLIGNKKVHLIAGGPPCQGFSTIGAQVAGDQRNKLFLSYLQIVKYVNPPCFLIENVNYLRTQYKGRYEAEIIEAFEALGYKVYVTTLNAADYGVPQIRKRVFFFGTKLDSDFTWPLPTHSDDPSLSLLSYETVGNSIMDLLVGERQNHTVLKHSEKVISRYALIPEGGRMPPPQELPEEIRRKNFGNTYKRLHRAKPSLTLVPGNNAFPVHPTENRSLTPREGARLQTFPDEYVFMGNRSQQCKLVGNAVPVLLARFIGEAIFTHIGAATNSNQSFGKVIDFPLHKRPTHNMFSKKNSLNAVSFFTGVGGLLHGFQNSGFNTLASYDKKQIVSKNMPINFPEIPHFHCDLSEISSTKIKEHISGAVVDVVFGGSPCQGFSIFGKRRFVNTKEYIPELDERNELAIHFIKLSIGLNPKVILMENVKGFISTPRNNSTYLSDVESMLKAAGYNFDHKIVNCADYGVPQQRERFILVAWRSDLTFLWPNISHHKEPKSWQRPYVTVGDVITDLMEDDTISQEFSHAPMAHKEMVVERYKLIPEGGKLPEKDMPEHLKSGYRTDSVKNFSHVYRRLSMDKPATTMVPGHNAFPIHPKLPRALTVREAARIQTFPDYFKFVGTRQQQCILVGNAVPPLLAEIFAHNIEKTIRGNFADPGFKSDIYELKANND